MSEEENNPFRSPVAADEGERSHVLTIFWGVLCFVGIVAIFLLPFWPGISIMLAIVLAPVFVHAYVRLYRRSREGEISAPLLQVGMLLGSFFIVTGIAVGTSIAGGLFCFATIVVLSETGVGEGPMILSGFFMGVLLPLAAFGLFYAMSLGFRLKRQQASSDQVANSSNSDDLK